MREAHIGRGRFYGEPTPTVWSQAPGSRRKSSPKKPRSHRTALFLDSLQRALIATPRTTAEATSPSADRRFSPRFLSGPLAMSVEARPGFLPTTGLFLQSPWQGELPPDPDFASPPDWLRVEHFPEDWDSAEESGWRKTSEGSYVQALDRFGARTVLATWEATGSSWWEGRYRYFLRREGKLWDLEADQVAPLIDGRLAIVRGNEVHVQDVVGSERLLLTTCNDRPRPQKPPAWATTWDGVEQAFDPAR